MKIRRRHAEYVVRALVGTATGVSIFDTVSEIIITHEVSPMKLVIMSALIGANFALPVALGD